MGQVLRLKPLRGEEWGLTPPEVVKDIWIKIQEFTGETDPLKEIRKLQNHESLKVLPLVEEITLQSRDPFLEALKFAIVGNSIDAMTGLNKEPRDEIFKRLERLAINPERVEQLKKKLKRLRGFCISGTIAVRLSLTGSEAKLTFSSLPNVAHTVLSTRFL